MRLKPRIFRKPQLTHPLARGLVGYWLHNEGSGLVTNDLSGNGNYGAITGPTWAAGGLRFDGTGDVVTMALPPTLVANSPVTVIISAKQTTSDLEAIINIQAAAGDPGQILLCYLTGGNQCRTSQAVTPGRDQASVTTINTNVWNQYTLTHPGTDTRGDIYVNGVLANGTPISVLSAFGANEFTIGAGLNATFDFTGDIEYCYVYDHVLLAGEILRLFRDPYILFRQDPAWIGQAAVAAPSPGQVIFITKAEREAAIKAALPVMWACQGINDRRDFMKYTGLAVIGL